MNTSMYCSIPAVTMAYFNTTRAATTLYDVLTHDPFHLFNKPGLVYSIGLDYIEKNPFLPMTIGMIVLMFLCYIISDAEVDSEDDESEIDGEDDSEVEVKEDEEEEKEDEEESEEEEDIPLRFNTSDIKYDQAANIAAYIYSRGLAIPNMVFPIKSYNINNKLIALKETSFMLKAKKYKDAPSESMQALIDKKPSIDELMEAYNYYRNLDYREYQESSEESEEVEEEEVEVDLNEPY